MMSNKDQCWTGKERKRLLREMTELLAGEELDAYSAVHNARTCLGEGKLELALCFLATDLDKFCSFRRDIRDYCQPLNETLHAWRTEHGYFPYLP